MQTISIIWKKYEIPLIKEASIYWKSFEVYSKCFNHSFIAKQTYAAILAISGEHSSTFKKSSSHSNTSYSIESFGTQTN